MNYMLSPTLTKDDKKARWLIGTVSVVVFLAVTILGKYNLKNKVDIGFDVHIFATFNALINGAVAVLLVAGLATIKLKNYSVHKKIMMTAMALSVLFLVSYIGHHLFAGDTKYGDVNDDGLLTPEELANVGSARLWYMLLLLTHIPLAGIALPFILFSAYRALIGEYSKHKKLVRYVWPIWFYVAVSGVVVYFLIQPYYK
jgi:putative membrane protein